MIVSDAIIAAARLRKIPVHTIAAILGVSPQRIDQRLRRFEKTTGQSLRISCIRPHRGRIPDQCAYCQKVIWLKPSLKKRKLQSYKTSYCSPHCRSLGSRILSEDDLFHVIEMRQSGQSWKSISAIFHIAHQAIQLRLWKYLHNKDMLTTNIVNAIWRIGLHDQGAPAAYNHLVNRTRISPSRSRKNHTQHLDKPKQPSPTCE